MAVRFALETPDPPCANVVGGPGQPLMTSSRTPAPGSAGLSAPPRSAWTWAVLLALLGLLALGVLTFDRSEWPSFVGDEATYLMQAESLAFDRDLRYTREDFDRFVAHWGQRPEGLILQSGDAGASITFGKPFFYPLWLAPFVRVAPVQGPFVANLVLLVAVSLYVARRLEPRLGRTAPLCVAAWVFASVAFAYTFWAHPDLFLMCLTALALGLSFGGPEPGSGRGGAWRWLAVGALSAVVVFSRPLYLTLFLPVLLAIPRPRWRTWAPALLTGAAGLLVGATAIHQGLAGSWTSYGGERRGFYSYTGFPEVDFAADGGWEQNLRDWGSHAWIKPREVLQEKRVVPSVWSWNALYFLTGRSVGLLPYFLPVLLGFLGRPRGLVRWSLVVAVALSVAGFFLLRSFNFYGGGGAIGNRYFLPLYPAFWFLATRPVAIGWPLGLTAVAGLFLGNLWLAPRAFPQTPQGTYRYITTAAQRLLPYETTQSHLKPSGRDDVIHHGLWVKFLDRGVWAGAEGEALHIQRGALGEVLVGSPVPLAALDLEVAVPAGTHVEVSGGRLRPLGETEGQRRFRVDLAGPRARHSMWWTWDEQYLYQLGLRVEGAPGEAVPFTLRPVG
jgi:hypothetical protein